MFLTVQLPIYLLLNRITENSLLTLVYVIIPKQAKHLRYNQSYTSYYHTH